MGGTAHIRREAKAAREAEQKEKEQKKAARDLETAKWEAHSNPKSKRDEKRQEQEHAEAEREKKRNEAKRLAFEEEAEMAKYGKPKGGATKKTTKFEIDEKKSAKERLRAKFTAQKEKEKTTYIDVGAVNVERNRADATSGEKEELQQQGTIERAVRDLTGIDLNEKRTTSIKVAYKQFEAIELPTLKEERPGLKKSQYDELLAKKWKKDPSNPINLAYPPLQLP